MGHEAPPGPPGGAPLRLHRDALTRSVYAWLATWGWFVFGVGPAVPLLRAEQGTSRAVAGLHGTMLAVGAVLAAAGGVAVVRLVGRRVAMSAGAVTCALGVVLLVSGGGVAATLAGALVAGTGGSLALNTSSPVLSDHHGAAGPAAISEANAVAAAVGLVAPLVVGAGVAAGLTWRAGVGVSVPLAVLAVLLLVRAPAAPALDRESAPRSDEPRRPMGTAFWALWGVLAAGIAVEFATTFWAGELLTSRLGVAPGSAAAAVAAFVAGMALGRAAAGSLALRVPAEHLLVVAIGLALGGWTLLWLAPSPLVAVLGLALQGLGVAVHFPLSIALLLRASGGRPDAAAAWGSLGGGIAIGTAPFALGALADAVGTHRGFLLVPALLVLAAGLLALAVRAGRASAPVAGAPGR